MKLPSTAHTALPWRIHEIAYDFQVLDVWALPTPGGAGDFPLLVDWMTSLDPTQTPFPVRSLFEIRRKLGEIFGWDDIEGSAGGDAPSLRDRLPADLRDADAGPAFEELPATVLYSTSDEFVAEVVNKTVHGVLHLGWVEGGDDYRGQLAVLVKPNGAWGRAYLAGISPFRHLIVYPALTRAIGSHWETTRASR